jgi:hypothetical protein
MGATGETWSSVFDAFKVADEIEVLRKAQSTLHLEIDLVRRSLATTYIDTSIRPWSAGAPNNTKLLDALAGYRTMRVAKMPGVYSKNPQHSWESHWADAVRYLMVYRHGDIGLGGWNAKPDFTQQDKAMGWSNGRITA